MCNTKICKRCNKEQPIDNFYKVPSMKDGHDNTCKTCRKELRRLRDGVEIRIILGNSELNYALNIERKFSNRRRSLGSVT